MRSSIVVAAVFLIVILFPSVSHSEVLGTAEFVHESCCWSWDLNYHSVMLSLASCADLPYSGFTCIETEFPDLLNESDVGTVLTATMENVGFSSFVHNVTNDHQEYVGVGFRVLSKAGGTACIWETELEPAAFDLDGNDFAGATITSASLTLEELILEKGTTYSGDDCLSIYCRVTMTIMGTWNTIATEHDSWGSIKTMYAE